MVVGARRDRLALSTGARGTIAQARVDSRPMVESNAVPRFLPSAQGLHFANSYAHGPTVTFGPLDPRWVGIGDAANGLCGGMSFYVRAKYKAGLPVPADTDVPANGSPLFKTIVRLQVQSLDLLRTPLHFWLAAALGPDRLARRSREVEWPRIRADIDAGRLSMVGLVRATGWNPFTLTQNHQVAAWAYEIDGDTIRLRLYEPNWPNRDDVTVTIEADQLRQSTGEPLFGVIRLA
jgi:hypothetical protein